VLEEEKGRRRHFGKCPHVILNSGLGRTQV
jgi:hypothetical protein